MKSYELLSRPLLSNFNASYFNQLWGCIYFQTGVGVTNVMFTIQLCCFICCSRDVGDLVLPFTPSACWNLPDEEMVMSAPDMCGIYEGSGHAAFQECLMNEPELSKTFLDACKYDYCENYLTTDPNEETTSGCAESNGK